MTTRPITARVEVALFNIIQAHVPGAGLVLDLFCGTGTLGLECLSRGSRRCCFAERDPVAVERLRRNIETMSLQDRSRIWRGDILRQLPAWLAELDGPIDLVFVDPPYALPESWDWQQAIDQLFVPLAERLVSDGLVILRLPSYVEVPPALGPLCVYRRREYGKMALVFLGKQPVAGSS
jgi:16S rRNA (guanine(966)-N(2))-methyltransferase RsmD